MPETALELDAGTDIGVESGMVDATSSASVLGSAGEAVESIGMTTKTAYPIQRRMSGLKCVVWYVRAHHPVLLAARKLPNRAYLSTVVTVQTNLD